MVSVVTPLKILPPVPSSLVVPVFSICAAPSKVVPLRSTRGEVKSTSPVNVVLGPSCKSASPVSAKFCDAPATAWVIR